MAGSRKSVGPINYHELPRRKLQALCKKYGFPANKTNVAMADALTALLNAPDRLGMRIDSPAVSSKSSYFSSSCDVEESPMISPGIDSLPSISESQPEVFEGLRITKLPEIMEIETSPDKEEVAANKTQEGNSGCDFDDLHASEVTNMITENSAVPENLHWNSNGNDRDVKVSENQRKLNVDAATSEEVSEGHNEVKEMECGGNTEAMEGSSSGTDRELKEIGYSDTTDTIVDDLVDAGPSTKGGDKEAESKNIQSTPDRTSRSEESVSENEADIMECENRLQTSSESEKVDNTGPTFGSRTQLLVSTSEFVRGSPLPVSEIMAEASGGRSDEATEPVEVTTTSDTSASPSEDENNGSLDDQQRRVGVDTTAERMTDGVPELISSTDHFSEAISSPEPNRETVESGDDTPLPLSIMPHSSVSDLSVSNQDGVRLVVELNHVGFPRIDMLETDGEIKISSHTSQGVTSRAGSQGLANQEPEFLRAAWMQDEAFGFKCLNPATLSPKVKRSLGIVIPKIPVSRLPLPPPPTCGPDSENETDSEFSFNVPLISHDISPVALASPGVKDSGVAMDVERTTSSEAGTACVSKEKNSQTAEFMSALEENVERSESCSPAPGYVKQILNLLESNSGEKGSAGASRKEFYKQSPMVRSSRIAADIERASKLGQTKRAAVLAGKRSLWPSTNLCDSAQETEQNVEENESLQSTSSGSLNRDETADEMVGQHDADVDKALLLSEKNVEEISSIQFTPDIILADAHGSPQHDHTEFRNNHSGSSMPPAQHCEHTDGVIPVQSSSPVETSDTALADAGTPEDQIPSAEEDVMNEDASSDKIAGATLPEIKYVEIPRPVETNVECGPISEMSWIRKAINLPTPKAQKLNEKIKRPVSANLRKFELMERAALNAAKKHRTPKKTSHTKADVLATNLTSGSMSSESRESTETVVDVQMEESSPTNFSPSLKKNPEKSTSALSLRDSNKGLGVPTVESRSVSPKSPAISLDEILRESTLGTEKENLRGKENERLKRHQEEYKTPLTGRSKEKALRAAEMNAASLREKILKQRRGIEEEEQPDNSALVLQNSLIGRLL